MFRNSGNRIFFGAVFLALFVAVFSFGAGTAEAASRVWPAGYWAQGGLLSCTGNYGGVVQTGGDGGPTATCDSLCDLLRTAQNIIDFAITLVVFVGAPAMVMFGGILYLISGTSGSDERRRVAKDVLLSAVIGIAITLGAYVILSTFLWLTGAATTGGGATGQAVVSWPNIECNLQ